MTWQLIVAALLGWFSHQFFISVCINRITKWRGQTQTQRVQKEFVSKIGYDTLLVLQQAVQNELEKRTSPMA